MIRYLSPIDVARLTVVRAPDLAARPVGPFSGGHPAFVGAPFLLRRAVSRRAWACIVALERGRLKGVATLHPHNGPTAWALDHLALTKAGGEETLADLLAAAAESAGNAGAERLLLYMPDEWHLQRIALEAGFRLSTQVLLFSLPGRRPLAGGVPGPGFRPCKPSDEFDLFRLYNACTPYDIRIKMGLTLQQWNDSREPQMQRARELVLREEGRIQAWLRLDVHRRWVKAKLLLHPDSKVDLQAIVAYAMDTSRKRSVWWEVPEYQESLQQMLEHMGFEANGCYRVLVNSLAHMVKERVLAPASTTVA